MAETLLPFTWCCSVCRERLGNEDPGKVQEAARSHIDKCWPQEHRANFNGYFHIVRMTAAQKEEMDKAPPVVVPKEEVPIILKPEPLVKPIVANPTAPKTKPVFEGDKKWRKRTSRSTKKRTRRL